MRLKIEYLLLFLCLVLIIIVIPPLQPAPFTIENSSWDGLSSFKTLIEEDMTVTETTTPLRLIGGIPADVIIIVGGNLPYFSEENDLLRQFVEEGGNLVLFEDNGYARQLTSNFGISLGGTVIDQDYHARNPYQPVINQSSFNTSEFAFSSNSLVFNKAVRVYQTRTINNTTFYPLFKTQGQTWEDKNHDGKFYITNESLANEICYLGGILSFQNGGNFVVIGDSAFPTNDMINRKENRAWLSELVAFLTIDNENKVLFDESRKLWIPPTGKGLVGIVSVLIMGSFHSPLIAIITLIVLGGIIGMKKDEQLNNLLTRIRKSFGPYEDLKPTAAFLQSEEEEELARITKSQVISDIYRVLLADEIQQVAMRLSPQERVEFENYLRLRKIDVDKYNTLVNRLKKMNQKRSGDR